MALCTAMPKSYWSWFKWFCLSWLKPEVQDPGRFLSVQHVRRLCEFRVSVPKYDRRHSMPKRLHLAANTSIGGAKQLHDIKAGNKTSLKASWSCSPLRMLPPMLGVKLPPIKNRYFLISGHSLNPGGLVQPRIRSWFVPLTRSILIRCAFIWYLTDIRSSTS